MKKLLIAILAVAPALARAGAFDVPNVSARDLALADSAVAAQQDAGATFRNPAALARLQGLNLALSASGLFLESEWKGFSDGPFPGQSEKLDAPMSPPAAIFASYGFEVMGRKMGVGLGANSPGGGNVVWADDWEGRGRIIKVDRKIFAGYLTLGYQVFPQLRIGGGAVYYYLTQYFKQGIQPVDGAFAELSTRGGALAYDVAAEFQPVLSLPLVFAVDYKHKGTIQSEGDGRFSLPGSLGSTPGLISQGVEEELVIPNIFNLGVSYRPVESVLVTAGYTFTRHVVYDADRFIGDSGLLAPIVVPRNYSNTNTYRLGVEWTATKQLTLRLGGLRDDSGYNPESYSPTLLDSDSWVGAIGAGWKFTPNLAANATVYYGVRDQVKSTGASSFQGTFDTTALITSVGLTYRRDLAR